MIDFEKRLISLKERRQGHRERAIFESVGMDSLTASLLIKSGQDFRKQEVFETLKESSSIKYTIGAMAPVDRKYTQVSIDEGHRVADSLIKSLYTHNELVVKRVQGSVALDIHIKGHSDIDMLIIVKNVVSIELPKIVPNTYQTPSDQRGLINILKDIRRKSEKILPNNFPKAVVDTSGNKSISISGGSLLRKVDIVPAAWYDTRQYQQTSQEHDRGIKIYHKDKHDFILNYPFSHIKLVNDRDEKFSGNLKCIIRLMKNMIADMPEYKQKIVKKLSSYDLTSIGYHMGNNLDVPYYMRLGLVEKLRMHLGTLITDELYRNSLFVPDNSRKIFDENEKIEALKILYKECTDLAESIFQDLQPARMFYDGSTLLNKMVS